MKRWFVLSAIGRDRPGLVAELSQLIFDCDANLEDSRMTILGTDFAVILLCSASAVDVADRIDVGAKRLERDHGLTILSRRLEGQPRAGIPAPGTQLFRLVGDVRYREKFRELPNDPRSMPCPVRPRRLDPGVDLRRRHDRRHDQRQEYRESRHRRGCYHVAADPRCQSRGPDPRV